ncbi:MAG TPA: sterol-binding protein [Gammaproteobacteria bacterium]|nr:sterol-binding protein [Gammaproteobacteria bacterium]
MINEAGQAAVVTVEQLLNAVISMDEVTQQRLAELHGRRIAIEFREWNLTLLFVPDAQGRLQISTDDVDAADATIRATPFDFAETLRMERKEDQVFKGKITLDGDTRLAQRFSDILAMLEIDWEEQLSKLTGDVAAHQLGGMLRGFQRWARRNQRMMRDNLGEYLTEEKQLLPTAFEVAEWRAEVDRLRDDVDRLAARVVRLLSAADTDQ